MICTFYSYKGGVGRSMALANVAALLAKWGKRVLIVDWDLEAPGIEKYFARWIRGSRANTRGVVDLMSDKAFGERAWRRCLLWAEPPEGKPIAILSAGLENEEYVARLRAIDWSQLFREHKFGSYLERLRSEWNSEFDFVLIDSRTGITDIGGICTIHLPDVLVALFTANQQSLAGVKDVMMRARRAHTKLPVDRKRLLVVPVPARDESGSEYKLAEEWRGRFADELKEFFDDWVPIDEKATTVLNYLKVPYFAYWSFGERVPVLEQEDPDNPKTLAYGYQPLARLILGKLDWKEAREGAAATDAQKAREAEAAEKTARAAQALADAQRLAIERDIKRAANEREEQQKRDAERKDQLDRFVRERCDEAITYHRWRAKRLNLLSRSVQLIALGSVALTAILPSLSGVPFARILSPFLGGVAMASFAVQPALNFEKRALLATEVANQLTNERESFMRLVATGKDDAARQARFMQRVEEIIAGGEDRMALGAQSRVVAPAAGDSVPKDEASPRAAEPDARDEAAIDYRYDVFISYHRRDSFVTGWLNELLPLLTSFLAAELPHDPTIFFDTNALAINADWAVEVTRAIGRSRCLLVIGSPSYFRSPTCMREWESFVGRGSRLVVPLRIQGGIPDGQRHLIWHDFTPFAFTGEGFRSTPRYVEFQDEVRRLAQHLAEAIRSAPPFSPAFEIASETGVMTTPAPLKALK